MMLTNEGNFPSFSFYFRFTSCRLLSSSTAFEPGTPAAVLPTLPAWPSGIPCPAWNWSSRKIINMASSMYKLVQTINSTKFRTEPFEDYYDVFEEIGRWESPIGMSLRLPLAYLVTTNAITNGVKFFLNLYTESHLALNLPIRYKFYTKYELSYQDRSRAVSGLKIFSKICRTKL